MAFSTRAWTDGACPDLSGRPAFQALRFGNPSIGPHWQGVFQHTVRGSSVHNRARPSRSIMSYSPPGACSGVAHHKNAILLKTGFINRTYSRKQPVYSRPASSHRPAPPGPLRAHIRAGVRLFPLLRGPNEVINICRTGSFAVYYPAGRGTSRPRVKWRGLNCRQGRPPSS